MLNMEIDIKIKLEDADIGLLIKSLFEILKKIPQDSINIRIDPNAKPPQPTDPLTVPLKDPCGDGEWNEDKPPQQGSITNTAPDATSTPELVNTSEPLYYSNNGESVKKIEVEKKNEKLMEEI